MCGGNSNTKLYFSYFLHVFSFPCTYPSYSLGQQSLSTARRSMEKEAPRGDHSQLLVHLWVSYVNQQFTHFLQ